MNLLASARVFSQKKSKLIFDLPIFDDLLFGDVRHILNNNRSEGLLLDE